MRIRIIRKPGMASLDGLSLHQFQVGWQYEVGNVLGALFLAEGWAEPIDDPSPAVVVPLGGIEAKRASVLRSRVARTTYPQYYDGPPLAADRRRRLRRSK